MSASTESVPPSAAAAASVSSSSPASPLPIVRIGGVPEHFNLPWHHAIEQKLFQTLGQVQVEWVECKLGTGQMINALLDGTADMVVALTEGLISSIALGSDLRLVGTYVESPLTWAISTGPNSAVQEVADLRGGRIGISRFTSGSHLMSCVLASQRGWKQSELQYVVEGSFEQLRNSVRDNRTEAFMWETFTTKPYHDSGEVRRVGEIVTPWPCFLIAARKDVLETKRSAIDAVMKVIHRSCINFAHAEESVIIPEISQRYGLKLEDAKAWYNGVRITGSRSISVATLDQTLHALKDAGILTPENYPTEKPLESFLDAGVTLEDDIKSMKLYHKPELLTQLWNNIRVRLGKEKGALNFRDLLPFDQNSYGGVTALKTCAELTHLTNSSRVIQLGSSVGGPSRYFAGEIGCEVLAIELQEDLHGAARELTKRCGLDDKVHHMAGNFLDMARHLSKDSYDCIASWLTVLHFDKEERQRLFKDSFALIKSGGYFYAEDFFSRGPLTAGEKSSLRHDVFCKYLPSFEVYQDELRTAGFEIVAIDDITPSWRQATMKRVETFAATRNEQVEIHGEELVKGLEYFYNSIKKLFEGENCGGLRVVARKPTK